MQFQIRKATADDAAGIAEVLRIVTGERIHSAILQPWPVQEQRAYIESLSDREAFHVAVSVADGRIIGHQSLDRFSSVLPAMSHVASVGTFVLPEVRGFGVAAELWKITRAFAVTAGYRKIIAMVRGSNLRAQAFYRGSGFQECGRLREQVLVDGFYDDEVVLECFLSKD
jgi:L-amino acid N-acyltransferase YncA